MNDACRRAHPDTRLPVSPNPHLRGNLSSVETRVSRPGTDAAPPEGVHRYEIAGCPACQATAARVVAERAALQAETEARWRFHLARHQVPVPIVELYDRAYLTQASPLHLVECASCGTLYRNPREHALNLSEVYAQERNDPAVLRSLFETQQQSYQRQARRLQRLAGSSGTGLEVGTYVGAFLAAAAACGWHFEGVDINEQASCFARSLGFTVWTGTLDDIAADRLYRAIAFWNCLDQLPDPAHTLRVAHDRLHPGGWLAVRVPNGSCYLHWRRHTRWNPLARLVLAHNNLLGFPYRQGFTPASLKQLLQHTGFAVRRMHGAVLVPLADRWSRPWAVWEERVLKTLLRAWPVARHAPWIELYAQRA